MLDDWLFGFIPESEDCSGWGMGRMRILMDKCEREWDKYDKLPPGLRERHVAIYEKAMALINRPWAQET